MGKKVDSNMNPLGGSGVNGKPKSKPSGSKGKYPDTTWVNVRLDNNQKKQVIAEKELWDGWLLHFIHNKAEVMSLSVRPREVLKDYIAILKDCDPESPTYGHAVSAFASDPVVAVATVLFKVFVILDEDLTALTEDGFDFG